MQESYYMLPEADLPEVFRKIIAVRQLLLAHPELSVSSACRQENLSRSAYYKYRDSLHQFLPPGQKTQVILLLHLDLALRTDLKLWQALGTIKALVRQMQLMPNAPEEALVNLVLEFESGEWEKAKPTISSWQQTWHGLKELKIQNVSRLS